MITCVNLEEIVLTQIGQFTRVDKAPKHSAITVDLLTLLPQPNRCIVFGTENLGLGVVVYKVGDSIPFTSNLIMLTRVI